MIEILTILVEHPFTFGFLVLCLLGFAHMTYQFILRLFGRNGLDENDDKRPDFGASDEPLEASNVPNPDVPPDGIMEAEEDIPCDGDEREEEEKEEEQEYEYNPDWNKVWIHSDWNTSNPYGKQQRKGKTDNGR